MTNGHSQIAILSIAALFGGALFFSAGGAVQMPRASAFVSETASPQAAAQPTSCAAIQDQVREQCTQMQESQWYVDGAADYPRTEHLKDISRCDQFAANIFHFCSNP